MDYTLKTVSVGEMKKTEVTDMVAVLQQLPEHEHRLQFVAVGAHGLCEYAGTLLNN